MRCVWIYLLPNQRAAQAEAGAREILPRARTPDLRPAKELIRNAAPRHCPPTRACQTAATRPTITRLSRAIFVTASRGSIIAASWAERGIARIRPTTPIPTVVCHVLDWCGATACARRLPAATRPARNARTPAALDQNSCMACAGFTWSNGACVGVSVQVGNQTGPQCTNAPALDRNSCMSCAGFTWSNGKCVGVPVQVGNQTGPQCSTPAALDQSSCMACAGLTWSNGACVGVPVQADQVGPQCTNPAILNEVGCATCSGYVWTNGVCAATPPQNSCPNGEVRNADNRCVRQPTCKGGEILGPNGGCECPSGKTRNADGVCVNAQTSPTRSAPTNKPEERTPKVQTERPSMPLIRRKLVMPPRLNIPSKLPGTNKKVR